jgi:hypothetical protein
MHGGAKGSGGPTGERNGNYRTGRYKKENMAILPQCCEKLRASRRLFEAGWHARAVKPQRDDSGTAVSVYRERHGWVRFPGPQSRLGISMPAGWSKNP